MEVDVFDRERYNQKPSIPSIFDKNVGSKNKEIINYSVPNHGLITIVSLPLVTTTMVSWRGRQVFRVQLGVVRVQYCRTLRM